ncbi:pentatricopeptide repeat-containing protein [Prunus yedoensis var. nudiflora]|uniref:Pentatricopeptide repeat-containing protein n=1 Tax=Prunus yedoensis var. nudiflora TaxID=2094558 RepID=A0A314XQT2_PRUYE|nr:pentatricopeptide repeat-containing protein [Prunus yedoensis var. nudiflora]
MSAETPSMTIVSSKLLPQNLHATTAQLKLTSHSPHTSAAVSCRVDPFDQVLSRSCKAGQFNESLYFLELMVNKGYKPDVILCTKLIKGFFNSRNIEKAIRVMQILEKYGEPDLFSYNALISGFCKANRIESANKVLDRMRSQGFSPML